MGYPSIDKFDLRFIERTLANVKFGESPNKFTHLINSLVGLIFIPNEFNKKGKRTYKIDFLNKPMSEYKLLKKIFSGEVTLHDENGKNFTQPKFFHKDKKNKKLDADNTTVGELVRLFRNGIAHQNIVPVGENGDWKGIIVKNYPNEKSKDHNFEVFLNQKELREFATLIATEYLKNTNH